MWGEIKDLCDCRCGGRPEHVTPKYGYANIRCNVCGISTKPRDVDTMDYEFSQCEEDWNRVMENK